MLELSIKSFDEGQLRIPNYGDIVLQNSWLSKDNKEYRFDRHAVSNTKQFLRESFSRYFENIKNSNIKMRKDGRPKSFPRFKSKKYCKNSYSNYNAWKDCHIDNDNHQIKIPCLGWVKYNPREKNIPDNWKIRHITISKSITNKYYCSICFQYSIGIDNIQKNKDKNINILGIDYSSSSLYVDSNSNKANYPKYYRSNQQKLRILQKKFSRQQKGSVNRDKTLQRIRVLHEKISNQRRDFLHKLSTSITKKFRIICVEDINMKGMSQCLHLGKSTMDNGFGMFREMLLYKQERIPHHKLILANKWFPSSKRCSKCGNIKSDLKLKDRIYKCNECGLTIDRDINAAINLKQYAFNYINGLSILC
jgi:putative transposase